MKSLVTALLFILPLSMAQALETIKLFDGKVAYCRNKADQFRHRLGAYTLTTDSVKMDGEDVVLNFSLQSVQCQKSGRGFGWARTGHLSESEFSSSEVQIVTVTPNSARLRSYRDGVFQLLGDVELDNQTKEVTLRFSLQDFLKEQEWNSLRDGKEVLVDIDSFLLKNLTLTGSIEMRTNISYGAYRTRFSLKLEDDSSWTAKKL